MENAQLLWSLLSKARVQLKRSKMVMAILSSVKCA